MADIEKIENPVTLYVAPNCGMKIDYDTTTYNAEFGLEYVLQNIGDFPLSSKPTEIRGWLSPMRDITLPDEVKPLVGIPMEATQFSYVYPPRGLADFIDWGKALRAEYSNCRISTSDEKKNVNNKWALGYIATFGAYAYFDEHHCLVGVNAITLKETPYELVFEGPFIAKSKAYKEIQDLNRYQSLYLDVFGEVGFKGSAWMDPGENRWIDRNVPSQSELDNEHGGFLYFRHDGSAVIFLIDLDDAIPTPNLGAGSLIRHAFRLCKHQIKMNSISTTCPAIHQSKDKIHRACQDGSKEHLNYLLDENPQNQKQFLLQQDEFGWTPLHYACCHNAQDDELISMLLEKCPDALFIQNNNNLSPIHLACDNNPSVQVIRKLLHYDTDKITLYLKSKHHGLSPLHFACSNSTTSIEVIRLLILSDSSGTTLFEKGIITATSLHTAIAGNHGHEVIDLILRSALNIDSIQTNPLLLERMNGMLPIHLACLKASSSETVSLLLNADHNDEAYYDIVGFCPEYDLMNSSVLHIAFDQSTKDVIDLLLIKEVKLRCKPSSKMIDLLDIVEGKTDRLPIHMACARKHLNVKTIKTLVGLKTNSVFCTDKNGNTPLHHICSNTHATYEIIEILLAAEKEYLRTSPKSKEIKSAVKTSNEQMYTPLCLAAQAGVTDAHLLLDPEHICLKGMDWDAKKGLLDLVLQNKSFQDKVVKNLAERQYFLLIMLELIANIVATAVYFTASIRSLDNVQIHPLQTATLISCITIFILRECIQLKGCTFVDYIIDGWNWIEVSSIVALSMATVHMIQLSSNENMLPIRSIFIWSGVLLVMQFIFIIRTTFLPFARFVAGLLTITCTLIPFFVVSGMVLLAFTYSFHMSGGRDEECTSFGICFLWTLGGFFFGQDDFMKTPFIDVLFGILAAVILLNVVIAIVSNAWDESIDETKEVFWASRVNVLFQYRFFKNFLGKKSCFRPLFDLIDRQSTTGVCSYENMPLWKVLLHSIADLISFVLGCVTLGIAWPQQIRERILSTGM